jgi:hypothetical protein
MPEVTGYGPADPQSLRLLSSGKAKAADAGMVATAKSGAKVRQPASVEVILGAQKAQAANNLTYENLKPKA